MLANCSQVAVKTLIVKGTNVASYTPSGTNETIQIDGVGGAIHFHWADLELFIFLLETGKICPILLHQNVRQWEGRSGTWELLEMTNPPVEGGPNGTLPYTFRRIVSVDERKTAPR